MPDGKFITIEGIEGAGKSTAVQFIKNTLQQNKIEVISTREPGGSLLAEQIRALLLYPKESERMEAETELLLMFAARIQHIKNCIIPALTAGKWIVCDRYVDASYAYQGGGRKIEHRYIQLLDQWLIKGMYPDLTFLLDIDPEQGMERASQRGKNKDRIEQEKIDFFIQVRDVYLSRAREFPERIKRIDSSQSQGKVESQIRDILDTFITTSTT